MSTKRNTTIKLSPQMKRAAMRLKPSASERIREALKDLPRLVGEDHVDMGADRVTLNVRISEEQRAMVAAFAESSGISPHQVMVRVVEYLVGRPNAGQ